MMANSPARVAVDVGSVIADTYTVEALLGRGGMGAVFLASHKRLAGKQVAIKILHTEIADEEVKARFRHEAEIAAKLNHPNIVGVIDYNVAPDGTPYLVLDYLEGETLASRIARGPLALDHAMAIVRQVGSALAAAHRAGIVHRDLKPQNIFLVATEVDGQPIEVAKVLDFGISKIRGSETVKTQDSMLLGTPQYMAPEQAIGRRDDIDERTDVFALGAIVYEMVSGRPAFEGDSLPVVVFKVVYEQPVALTELVPSLPPAIADAVAQAMAKPAAERFASVGAFVEALTGRPLPTMRGQATREATHDAFARTMGSGDHGSAPVNPMLATAAADPAAPSAPSKSLSHTTRPAKRSSSPPNLAAPLGPEAPNGVTAAPTLDAPAAGPAASPKPRRRTAAVIAVVAGAALAAGGIAVAIRSPTAPATQPRAPIEPGSARSHPPPPATEVGAAAPVPSSTDHAASAGSGAGKAPAAHAPARPTEPKLAAAPRTEPAAIHAAGEPHVKPSHRGDPAEPSAEETEVGADLDDDIPRKLHEASVALAAQSFELAERLSSAVIHSPAGPKQRATARLIHGQVACLAHNDQEAAQIDARSLENFRALRTRLVNACRSHGIALSP
jgi:serine/threonine-protein kinase